MIYYTDRLIFREYKENDFELLFTIFSDEEVMKFALMEKCNSREELYPYFNQILTNNKASNHREAYEYAVYRQEDEAYIGIADIEMTYFNGRAVQGEIGYFIKPEYWGRGYATEIANELVKICFTDLKLHRVVASCNANNHRSEHIMKKVGMIKEGEFRKIRYKDGIWNNELRYSILYEEWDRTMDLKVKKVMHNSEDLQSLILKLDVELEELYPKEGIFGLDLMDSKVNEMDFAVVYNGNCPVGCGAIRPIDGESVELKRVYVEKDYRRKGIASILLTYFEKLAQEKGYDKIRLETGPMQIASIKLYERHGYIPIELYGEYIGSEYSLCYEKKI